MPATSRERSTGKAIGLFLGGVALYLAAIGGIVLVEAWVLRGLLSGVAAFATAVLFVIGHDACHGAFTNHRWLNAVLGRLAFLPSWHPYAGWEHAHNRVHHAWTNLRGEDYAWAPLSKGDFARLSRWGRLRERFYRSLFGFGCYYFYEVYCKKTLWPSAAFRGKTSLRRLAADDALVLAFVLAQAICLVLVGQWLRPTSSAIALLLFAQWLPLVAFNWLIGFLIFLHHTHPLIAWFDDRDEWSFYLGQIRGTAHVTFPGPANWLIANIMEHTAHHADPRVPLYRLGAAQAAIERAFPQDVVLHKFTWHSFRYTLRACQLYDYRNHCWLSFAGTPTTSRTIPAIDPAETNDPPDRRPAIAGGRPADPIGAAAPACLPMQ